MNLAARSQALGHAPRERGWSGLALAVAVTAIFSTVAHWPASLSLLAVPVRWLLPLEPFGSLVLCGLGACAIASWARSGKWAPAVIAVIALVWWVLQRSQAVPSASISFQAGWTLIVSAFFGWFCASGIDRPFLARAIPSTLMAGVLTVSLLFVKGDTSGLVVAYESEYEQRRGESLLRWQERRSDPAWQSLETGAPSVVRSAEGLADRLTRLEPPVAVVPGLLILETIAGLLLSWSLWHRLARRRLGPSLPKLSQFRFDDQLVWGFVAGAVLVFLPSLDDWRFAGLNLLLVFGVFHALRGLGVLLWWTPNRVGIFVLTAVFISLPLLGPVPVATIAGMTVLCLGLGDTWRDLRRAGSPLRPDSRP